LLRKAFFTVSGKEVKIRKFIMLIYETVNQDALVKSRISPPLVGGDKEEGGRKSLR
jgi:hypothetical protein